MQTILNQAIDSTYSHTAQGCAGTPITVMVTLLTGPNFVLFVASKVAMAIALVTNLAAMPTKVTIPSATNTLCCIYSRKFLSREGY